MPERDLTTENNMPEEGGCRKSGSGRNDRGGSKDSCEDRRSSKDSRPSVFGCDSAPVTGAVILAAGYSSRMKKFKALLPVDGMSAVERVITCARNAGISEIVLVTGYQRELLGPVAEKYGVAEVYNKDFDKGMFSSIQAGVGAMKDKVDGFFLMPVDCPVIRQDIMNDLAEEARRRMKAGGPETDAAKLKDRMIVPCYMGKKGHPLFIPSCYADEILLHDGERGLKGVTDKYDDRLDRIEVESESVILDMDDEEGYREVCAYAENGFKETSLAELAEGRRFILVRHGQIKQHREKIFLGQTDVPLSETGKQQAKAAGEALAKEKIQTDRIYTSDLSRASETAQIVARALGIERVIMEPGLREMALGEWDGRYISEIKEEYPEAYERRGRDILKFKFGNNSENFYDLRYRVLKTLKKILKNENSRDAASGHSDDRQVAVDSLRCGTANKKSDIFIVAHKGVIQMIACALTGRSPEDRWPDLANGEYIIIQKIKK